MADTIAVLYIAAVVFGIILAVAWIVLPFALIGTKPILREIRRELQRNNELLSALVPRDALPVSTTSAAAPSRRDEYARANQHPTAPRAPSALPPT